MYGEEKNEDEVVEESMLRFYGPIVKMDEAKIVKKFDRAK